MFEYGGLIFTYYGHSCFSVRGQKTVCIDPFEIKRSPEKADVVICTHDHIDHCSPTDIKRFARDSTVVLASANCKGKIMSLKVKDIKYIRPGEQIEVNQVKCSAVPAYNVNKFRSPGRVYHPKEYLGIGAVLDMDGVRVYHAGDTDLIPEMSRLGDVDVAVLPVSGTYVMTPEEAADAVRAIMPKVAIPMHYGSIVGGVDDAKRFREIVGGAARVAILERLS